MKVYFAPLACSMASRVALAEAGATAEFVEVDLLTKTLLATGEDYLAIHPLGVVPALRLDDGTLITENVAILQYLADAFPAARLAPPPSDRLGRARLQQWLSFVASELHRALMAPLLNRQTPPEVRAWAFGRYANSRFAYLDQQLDGRSFLLEAFSVADAYLATVLNWTRAIPEIDLAPYANVNAYLDRLRARPSIAAALAYEMPLYKAEIARRKAA